MARGIISFVKKQKLVVLIAGLVVVLVSLGLIAKLRQHPSYETVLVKRGAVVQQVSATGSVTPIREVDLGFTRAGTVAHIFMDIGQTAKEGEVIASLDTSELDTQFAQAQASLASQQANLESLTQGTRPEELAVDQAKVQSAQVTLTESQKSVVNAIQGAYTSTDDAIRNDLDQIFSNPRSPTPQVVFLMSDATLQAQIVAQRVSMEQTLLSWNASLAHVTVSGDLSLYLRTAEQNLSDAKTLLDGSALAVNALTANGTLSQTTITSWKGAISAARTEVNAAITSVYGAEDAWKTAQAGLTVAQSQWDLAKAGSTQSQIDAQQALVDQARANVQNIQVQINNMSIRAPFDGVLTRQDAKVGEVVSANQQLIGVISNGQFEIDANIPEVDIAKIAVGDHADVTLDAYGPDTDFRAHVVSIDPGETIVEGMPTYKTTLNFDQPDQRIRSGMTANITIAAAQKDNVLVLPQRVVIQQGSNQYVLVPDKNGATGQVQIQTGLRGSDGNIEIVSGLSEGDAVAVPSLSQ